MVLWCAAVALSCDSIARIAVGLVNTMHMVAVTAGPGHYHYRHMTSTIPKASVQILFVRLRPMEL